MTTTPHTAQARHIERQHPGWSVWWGPHCAGFLATHPNVSALVMAATAEEITDLIGQWTRWSLAMAPIPPR
jgi:hypothetical protein